MNIISTASSNFYTGNYGNVYFAGNALYYPFVKLNINTSSEYKNINTAKMENIIRLNGIAEMEDDWNDNGAAKFSRKLIDYIKNIIDKVIIQPEIFPTANDSIQLEYEKDNGDYLEFNMFENGELKIFTMMSDGYENVETVEFSMEIINGKVKKFYGL